MRRDFFFLPPQRACEARTLRAHETLRLLLRCLIADFKEKKRLFCSTAKDVMRKLSFVKVAMY